VICAPTKYRNVIGNNASQRPVAAMGVLTLMTPSTTVRQLKVPLKATVVNCKLSGALDLNL
jgi:hypothetical protein